MKCREALRRRGLGGVKHKQLLERQAPRQTWLSDHVKTRLSCALAYTPTPLTLLPPEHVPCFYLYVHS